MSLKQHKFKPPARPLEPPTPRTSVLGLDRLAKEKRAASNLEDGDMKRQKLDSDRLFKGAPSRETLPWLALFLTPKFQFPFYLDPALEIHDSEGTKHLRTRAVCPKLGGRNSRSTAGTGIGREVTQNFHHFLTRLNPWIMQRVSTQSKSAEMAGKRGLVNFSDVQIEIVGTTDAIGTKHLVQNEAGASVSRMWGGNLRRAIREVTEGDGVGLATDLGMLRLLASHVTPAQTETVEHLVSTHGNGRRSKFASTATGTRERKKVVLLAMKNTTLCRSTKILQRQKKRRLLRNRS